MKTRSMKRTPPKFTTKNLTLHLLAPSLPSFIPTSWKSSHLFFLCILLFPSSIWKGRVSAYFKTLSCVFPLPIMGSKFWLVFLMLATALVVESTTLMDDADLWGLSTLGHDNNGFEFSTEMMMDSEINHRLLAQKTRYISYGALRANSVPCNRRGSSYYNCNKRQRANPYRRGCSTITRCRRYTH